MSSTMNTILVIGGTSGIGEAFVKRWHSMGKKLIVTGRRKDRLDKLAKDLSGLNTYVLDNTELNALPNHVGTLFELFPAIDAVWINGGKAYMSSIKDVSSSSDANVVDEVATNITGPTILARHIIPRLLAQTGPTQFMVTGSGLGFVPSGHFPVYCPTKAFVHQFMVGIRQSLRGTNVNVIEIVPPFIKTELLGAYEESLRDLPAMPLDEFVDEIFHALDNNKAEHLKEVAGGSAVPRVKAWRDSIGEILVSSKMGG